MSDARNRMRKLAQRKGYGTSLKNTLKKKSNIFIGSRTEEILLNKKYRTPGLVRSPIPKLYIFFSLISIFFQSAPAAAAYVQRRMCVGTRECYSQRPESGILRTRGAAMDVGGSVGVSYLRKRMQVKRTEAGGELELAGEPRCVSNFGFNPRLLIKLKL